MIIFAVNINTMSRLYIIFILLTLVTFFNSCSTDNNTSEPIYMIANYEIAGMVCEHGCKGVIEKEMNKVIGITSFEIDFENSIAEVFFDKNVITSNNIMEKVETINDGIYQIKLIKEYKQINAKESLPSSTNNSISVSTFSFQIPNVTRFISEWIKI